MQSDCFAPEVHPFRDSKVEKNVELKRSYLNDVSLDVSCV